MQSTFEQLLSPDNATRQSAEALITKQLASSPLELASNLVQGLNQQVEVATMCCILLKKYFLDIRSQTELGAEHLDTLGKAVLASIDFEKQPLLLLKRKGDVLSRIYVNLKKVQELIAYILPLLEGSDPKVRQFAMYIFEVLSEVHLTSEQLSQYSNEFKAIFGKGLNDQDNNVRVASLRAISAFLSTIEDQQVVLLFADVLNLILGTVITALNADEDQGRVALESLGELTNAHPEVWKDPSQLLQVTSQVISNVKFEDATRSAAVEVILSLSGTMPAALRKAEGTKTLVYPALVSMLTEVEKDDSVWAQTEEDQDGVGKDPVSTAISAISRLSEDLGAKTTFACTQEIIGSLIQNENWLHKQAGYTLLGLISSATKEILKQNMTQAFITATQGVKNENMRVRYAAFGALGMLFTDLAPHAQKNHHEEVINVLIQHMVKESSQKMQTQATSALLNFVQGLVVDDEEGQDEETEGSEILERYTEPLFQALTGLLIQAIQQKYEPLQTEVLNVLHSICQVILTAFGDYFGQFMPLMGQILTNVGGETMEDKKLRAKAIDTIGSMIIAVSDCEDKSQFDASVKEVTTHLMSIIQKGLSDDDPQDEAIKNTLTQCAGFLQKDFDVYMPRLINILLNDAQLEIDFKIENADAPQTAGSNPGYNVKVKGLGEQRISVKTENLVKKTSAFGLMEQVSENMGTSFAPYVKPLLPIIVSHMTYAHSRQIKKFSLKTFKNILVAVGESENVQYFQQALPIYINEIGAHLNKMEKKDVKLYIKQLAEALKALNETNDLNREFLSDAQIAELGSLIKRTLDLVTALRQATKKVIQTKKMHQEIDEEDAETMKKDLAKVSDVACQVMELTGQLVEIFKNRAYVAVRDNAQAFFYNQLLQYRELTEDELLDALCFFCDYVENTDARTDAAAVNLLAEKFLEISMADPAQKPDSVQQTICYGFGVFAINLNKGSFNIFPQAAARCKLFVSGDDAFDEDRIVCTESTLGALAKIAYNHLDGKNVTKDDLIKVLSKMPFTSFSNEALTSHRILIEQFMTPTSEVQDPRILAAAKDALKRIRDYNGDVKILTHQSRQQLSQLKL